MTRPSRNIDKKLIRAGKELITEKGFSGLKVRDVSKRAGVNLGMFNYHFGTKDEYVEALIIEVYNEFFSHFQIEAETGNTPLERLRNALINGAFFIRDNRQLITAFIEEVIKGNRRLVEFARKNMLKHVQVLIKLLKQCQREGYIVKAPLTTIAPMLVGSVALPNVVIRVLEKNYRNTFLGAFIPVLKSAVLSDKKIIERIGLTLNGVSSGRGR